MATVAITSVVSAYSTLPCNIRVYTCTCCTMSRIAGVLTFLFCNRRTNVALSRGRHHLLIVGHADNLRQNTLWSRVVSYLEGNNVSMMVLMVLAINISHHFPQIN